LFFYFSSTFILIFFLYFYFSSFHLRSLFFSFYPLVY